MDYAESRFPFWSHAHDRDIESRDLVFHGKKSESCGVVHKFVKLSTSVADISRALHCFERTNQSLRRPPCLMVQHVSSSTSRIRVFPRPALSQHVYRATPSRPQRNFITSPSRGSSLSALAAAYLDLSMLHTCTPTTSSVYGGAALKIFLEVYHSDFAPPLLCIQAAHIVSDVYVSDQQIEKARMLLMKALKLFPLVTSCALDLEDQQRFSHDWQILLVSVCQSHWKTRMTLILL